MVDKPSFCKETQTPPKEKWFCTKLTHFRESQLSLPANSVYLRASPHRRACGHLAVCFEAGREIRAAGSQSTARGIHSAQWTWSWSLWCPVPGERIHGMQPDATDSSRAGQVTGCTSPSGERVTSEWNALFPGAKHKACSSKVGPFVTEKTKLPVFMKIYTCPGKNGGGAKSHIGNTVSTATQAGDWNGYWEPFHKAGRRENCNLINTSLPLEISHTGVWNTESLSHKSHSSCRSDFHHFHLMAQIN